MKKTLILALFIALAAGLNVNYISAQETTTTATASAEAVSATSSEITTSDLGVANPGILPTSPFYFLKNWGRAIERIITINPVKRANLELEISNQQAAEIERMKEISPERIDAISKAADNYKNNVDRLKARLDALKETSKNPNVDALVEKLADRSIKHQQLFDELKKKFENQAELKNKLEAIQEKVSENISEIPKKFETPEAFKERLQRMIEKRPEGILKELKGAGIIDRLGEKLPESDREKLQEIKENLIKNVGDKEINKEAVGKLIEEVKGLIVKAESGLVKVSNQDFAARVKKAIDNAKYHLPLAEKTLADGKVGEAFGHITAAGAAARNALMMLAAPIIKGAATSSRPLPPLPPKPGAVMPESPTGAPQPQQPQTNY